MAAPRHPTFEPGERAFIRTMYQAGVAGSLEWLTSDQIKMADEFAARLARLPEPSKPRGKAKAKGSAAATTGTAPGPINNDG